MTSFLKEKHAGVFEGEKMKKIIVLLVMLFTSPLAYAEGIDGIWIG